MRVKVSSRQGGLSLTKRQTPLLGPLGTPRMCPPEAPPPTSHSEGQQGVTDPGSSHILPSCRVEVSYVFTNNLISTPFPSR